MAGTALKTTQVDLLSGLGQRDQQALIRHAKQHGITLYGLDETLQALRTIDPTIRKNAQKRIRKVPAEVQKKTKARVPSNRPMRNWGGWSRRGGVARGSSATSFGDVGALRWDDRAVKSGIRLLTGGQKLNVRLLNKSAPGGVFEMAGSKGTVRQPMLGNVPRFKTYHPASQVFQNNMKMFGVAPRLLIKTWRDEKGIKRTASEIGKVAKFAEEEVKRRIG